MFLFNLLKFFVKVPASGKFIYNNFFSILKNSLKIVGGFDDALDNFSKINSDKKLQHQFSKIFYNSYANSVSTARSRDAKIIMRNGRNFRADLIFYSVVFCFIISTIIVVFFKNRLTPDFLAFFSVLAGVSGSCLKEIFGFEFGVSGLTCKSKNYYLLDEYDKTNLVSQDLVSNFEC